MNNCNYCKATVPDGAVYCLQCGQKIVYPPPASASFCSKCGNPLALDHEFCGKCGAKSASATITSPGQQIGQVSSSLLVAAEGSSLPTRPPTEVEIYNLIQIIYLLSALSYLTCGITGIVGVVMAYSKRIELAGTWFASHLNWQIRTFWISLFVGGGALLVNATIGLLETLFAWHTVGSIIVNPMNTGSSMAMIYIVNIFHWAVMILCFGGSLAWVIYRIVKGWLKLSAHQPIEASLF